jgi:hypothetical protein
LKRQRGCTKIKLGKRKKAEPFALPKSPGILAGFYFSCGPLAGLGFFVGNGGGFVFAIVGDVMFWVLIALLKERKHTFVTKLISMIFQDITFSSKT